MQWSMIEPKALGLVQSSHEDYKFVIATYHYINEPYKKLFKVTSICSLIIKLVMW